MNARGGRRKAERGLAPHDPFRALLWDLDGTLVDSREDLATAVNHTLADMERPPLPTEEIVQFVGRGARNLLTRSLERSLGESVPDSGVDRAMGPFLRHYDRCCLEHTRLYPGLRKLLLRLRDRGRPMGVVTNKPERVTWRILEGLDLLSCFQAVVGDVPGRPRKPDGAPSLHALELMGRDGDVERSMMIGDSMIDLESAHAAGVPCCLVGWGFGDTAAMRLAGPAWWADSVPELAELLLGKRKKRAGERT